jgi:PAS domain S-box-containing protein
MQFKSDTANLQFNPMAVSIFEEKKIIVHNILRGIVFIGLILNIVTIIRDIDAGLDISNSLFNSLAMALMLGILIFRKKISLEVQTAVLLAVCLIIGFKLVLINGVTAGTFYFFVISSIVALLIFPRKTAFIIIGSTTTLYIILMTTMAFGILKPLVNQKEVHVKVRWLAEIISYLFVLFVIIGGVGRLHQAFMTTIQELDETNQKLNQSNEELLNQLEQIKAMQKKVEQKDINFKRIFEESNDGIILCNADSVIIESNNAIGAMLEYPKSFLIGRKASDFVIHDDKRLIDQLSIDKVHHAKVRELHLLTRGGIRIPVEINYSPIEFDGDKTLLVTIRDVRERKQTEQRVLNAVIQAEENERSRFAKDLHDDLGPILSSIKMYIQSLRTHEDSENKKDLINRLIYTVDDSIKSIRRISYNLSSHLLQNMGLINALKTHADRINLTDSLKITVTNNFPELHRLASNVEIVIYRVVLELITNSIKHSQGTLISIDLSLNEEQLIVNYSDNGIGFDIDRMMYDNTKGIGLKNILSRVKSIKGLLSFETEKSGFNLLIDVNI